MICERVVLANRMSTEEVMLKHVDCFIHGMQFVKGPDVAIFPNKLVTETIPLATF